MSFKYAKPVWLFGMKKEENVALGAKFVRRMYKGQFGLLRITASSLYRVFINGNLEFYGPCKGVDDYHRIDEWKIRYKSKAKSKLLVITIEVVGYNLDESSPPFLQAEMFIDDELIVHTETEGSGFYFCHLDYRIQHTNRFSGDRGFVEKYKLDERMFRWYNDSKFLFGVYPVEEVGEVKYLERNIPYPELKKRLPKFVIQRVEEHGDRSRVSVQGDMENPENPENHGDRSNEKNELPERIKRAKVIHVNADSYIVVDLEEVNTAFISFKVSCDEDIQLEFTFDELLIDGNVDPRRLECKNIVEYTVAAGTSCHVTVEPYSFRYIKIKCKGADCVLEELCIREYISCNMTFPKHYTTNTDLRKIYKSAENTFVQCSADGLICSNSVERESSLFYSFFLSRASFYFTGDTLHEYNFLEQYLIKNFNRKGFLPFSLRDMKEKDRGTGLMKRRQKNGAMWFITQLEEYSRRCKKNTLIELFKPKVYEIIEYLGKFENGYWLLENLEESFNLEGDLADCAEIDFLSNMQYSYILKAAGKLYGDEYLLKKSEVIKHHIKKLSYNGRYFADFAYRDKTGSIVKGNRISELCQYFAYFFDIADSEDNLLVWDNIVNKLGPGIENNDIVRVSRDGLLLRFELLWRYDEKELLHNEIISYFSEMAEKTTTLWEGQGNHYGCNFGAWSCVAFWLGTTQYSSRLFSENYAKR